MPGNLDRMLAKERGFHRARRPRLDCCTPYRTSFPSGIAWAHSTFCGSSRRGQKLTTEELQELGADRAERPRALTPEQANRLRPTGATALLCWLAHGVGCACFACRYTEEHLDDGDERGGSER